MTPLPARSSTKQKSYSSAAPRPSRTPPRSFQCNFSLTDPPDSTPSPAEYWPSRHTDTPHIQGSRECFSLCPPRPNCAPPLLPPATSAKDSLPLHCEISDLPWTKNP